MSPHMSMSRSLPVVTSLTELAALRSEIPGENSLCLIFGAQWCKKCHELAASMEREGVLGTLHGRIRFGKVDVEDGEEVAER